MLVWWGKPCRDLLEAGDVDLLTATLALVAQAGLLLRYHRTPGPLAVTGVGLTAFLGWFAHPMLMVLSAPLVLFYYLTVGARHRLLWQGSLAGALAAGVAANLFWLPDWIDYAWIRTPLNLEAPVLTARTLAAVWAAPLWGEPADRTLACFLVPAALIGVVLLHVGGRRAAARLLGLAIVGWLLLAALAVVWGPLARRRRAPFRPGPAVRRGAGRLRPGAGAAAGAPLGRLGQHCLLGGGASRRSLWPCPRTATPGRAASCARRRC